MAPPTPPTPRIPQSAVQAAYSSATLTFVGQGGQGDVWRARSGTDDEALRVVIGGDPRRIAQEVNALRQLSSPHLMRFHALESLQHGGTDYPVIRGEFIEGGTVADKLRAAAAPTLEEALECVQGVLEALVLLDDADLIHRDVKPENIALRSGRWRESVLLDLGFVRAVTLSSLTVYPHHIGTWPYMGPEQLRREPAKTRSDIFALGVVLFQLVTDEHPFLQPGESVQVADLIDRIATVGPRSQPLGRIDPSVRPLVESMLAAEPHNRPSPRRARQAVNTLT